GWLEVIAGQGAPQVTAHDVPIRTMHRWKVEAAGRTPDQLTADLVELVAKRRNEGALDDAVVSIVVSGISRDLWRLVDTGAVREAAADTLHFELICRPGTTTTADTDGDTGDNAAAQTDTAAVLL